METMGIKAVMPPMDAWLIIKAPNEWPKMLAIEKG